MASITFQHPLVRNGAPLAISVGPDDVRWSYLLNTQSFHTYAGEVVQILSVAIDAMTIHGRISTIAEMENIYNYFMEYMQIASQGAPGTSPAATTGSFSYNQQPMIFTYPARNWIMNIMPMTAPAYRKSREVIASEWRLQAFVVDDGQEAVQELKDLVTTQLQSTGDDDFSLTGEISAAGGAFNPFSAPFTSSASPEFDPSKTQHYWDTIATSFNNVIPAWLSGDYSSLTNYLGSKPAFLQSGAAQQTNQTHTNQQATATQQQATQVR